jgi:hypothetical protein
VGEKLAGLLVMTGEGFTEKEAEGGLTAKVKLVLADEPQPLMAAT